MIHIKAHLVIFMDYYEEKLKAKLKETLKKKIAMGYTNYIFCPLWKTDIAAAKLILEETKHNNALKLICVLPNNAYDEINASCTEIVRTAHCVVTVGDEYYKECYKSRNKYTIDCSRLVIEALG